MKHRKDQKKKKNACYGANSWPLFSSAFNLCDYRACCTSRSLYLSRETVGRIINYFWVADPPSRYAWCDIEDGCGQDKNKAEWHTASVNARTVDTWRNHHWSMLLVPEPTDRLWIINTWRHITWLLHSRASSSSGCFVILFFLLSLQVVWSTRLFTTHSSRTGW